MMNDWYIMVNRGRPCGKMNNDAKLTRAILYPTENGKENEKIGFL